jgi:hypothetical protein
MWNNEMIESTKELLEKYKDIELTIIKLTADPRFTAEIADDPHAFLEGLYSFKPL